MPERVRHHAVLLIGPLDRRVVPALRFVNSLPDTDVHALHVSFDTAETRRLAEAWMELDATWLPLRICEPADGRMTPAIRAAVAAEAEDAGAPVTVIIPELELRRWWHGLLHRRTGRRLALALQDLPGVTAVLVPYRPRQGGRARSRPESVKHLAT